MRFSILCESGVTGGRASLRSASRKGWGFESPLSHQSFLSLEIIPVSVAMNSLFVVSLPRSLSSLTYYIARVALGLIAPSWTSDGEIMNIDRFALYAGPRNDANVKFLVKEDKPALFERAIDFLDQATVPHGFAYKDVIHPFVVAEWLKQNEFRVLRIKRNLTNVVFSMLAHNWLYPRVVSQNQDDTEEAVIEGLIRADMALDSIP